MVEEEERETVQQAFEYEDFLNLIWISISNKAMGAKRLAALF